MNRQLLVAAMAMGVCVPLWAAPFNPSRYIEIAGTNFPNFGKMDFVVAMDGDHLIASGQDALTNGTAFILQRHFGGANKWNLRATYSPAFAVGGALPNVALAGDVAVVAMVNDDTLAPDAGAVHILMRNHPHADAWGHWKTLYAPVAFTNSRFGASISTDGRYLAVSSLSTNPVYLYARNAGGVDNWGLIKTIPNPHPTNQFDAALSLDGDRLAVGDSRIPTNQVVRLYERNSGGAENWGLIITLAAADGQTSNGFGCSVSLDGTRLAVGANNDASLDGAVYLFDQHQGGTNQWGQKAKLLPTPGLDGQMGRGVTLRGDTLVTSAHSELGARASSPDGGALYVFQRNAGGADSWGRTARLLAGTNSAELGTSVRSGVALGDDVIAAATHPLAGAAVGGPRVFQEYFCPDWTLLKTLPLVPANTNQQIGLALALEESALVVGSALGGFPNPAPSGGGFVHCFRNVLGADFWGVVLSSGSNETNALAGTALSIHNRIQAEGRPGSAGYGVVRLYERGSNRWEFAKDLSSPDTLAGEKFGTAVGVWDDTVVVGAPQNFGLPGGAAFVYSRNQGGSNNWGLVQRLNGSGQAASDELGTSVAIFRDTIAVGAPYEYDASGGDGAVYIFGMNQGGSNNWGEVKKIKVPVVAGLQNFGWRVALWGDLLAVGDISDGETENQSGAVYLFERNRGGKDNWGLVKKLKAPAPETAALFGSSVALRGDRLLVGEPLRDATFADEGRAYVYERNMDGTDQWGLVQRITSPTPQVQAWFGYSAALSSDRLAVGAPREDVASLPNSGAVYLFQPGCLRITTTNDVVNAGDGLTSLREAINLANASTQKQFAVDIPDGEFVFPMPTSLAITNVTTEIIVRGQGARRTILNHLGAGRMFSFLGGTTGDVRDLTIKNCSVPDGGDRAGSTNGIAGASGAAIYNDGDWRVVGCTIVSNFAGNGGNAQVGQGTQVGPGGLGGGIANYGTLTIRQSTISHNRAGDAGATGDVGNVGGDGGGIFNSNAAQLTILNSTIYGNAAGQGSASANDGYGGGIFSFDDVTIRHSTISHNDAGSGANRGEGGGVYLHSVGGPSTFNFSILNNNDGANSAPDGRATFTNASYNLISNTNGITFSGTPMSNIVGVLALLGGAPDNNGGQTDTMMPQPGSPVIDKGDASFGSPLANDQRGYLRPTNGITIDLGAVERTTDFDGDGMSDDWEKSHGTDFEEPADGSADLDGDGLDGRYEYVADLHPYVFSEPFELIQIATTGNARQIHFISTNTRNYTLETTTSLTNNATWFMISGQVALPGVGGPMTLVYTNSAPVRAYRVRIGVP